MKPVQNKQADNKSNRNCENVKSKFDIFKKSCQVQIVHR